MPLISWIICLSKASYWDMSLLTILTILLNRLLNIVTKATLCWHQAVLKVYYLSDLIFYVVCICFILSGWLAHLFHYHSSWQKSIASASLVHKKMYLQIPTMTEAAGIFVQNNPCHPPIFWNKVSDSITYSKNMKVPHCAYSKLASTARMDFLGFISLFTITESIFICWLKICIPLTL